MSNRFFLRTKNIAAIFVLACAITACDNPANSINRFTVSFVSNGGSSIAPQTVPVGGKAVKPWDVKREGYTLEGWYLDNVRFDNQWNFAINSVTKNTVLFARWTTN